jgi:KUP system potassium uptake protein
MAHPTVSQDQELRSPIRPNAPHPAVPTDASTLAGLSLGALGVVFGDIGTSPLYALRQCLQDLGGAGRSTIDAASIFGILSLIVWALILVVCVKYATFVLRADHEGEGGILAMLALIQNRAGESHSFRPSIGTLTLIVLAGSALLYGDGVITPAISVLSAVEGIKIAAPGAEGFVLPASLAILVGLFLLQSRGTEVVGRLFGPVMALWFVTIGALGVRGIWHAPQILQGLNPIWAIRFLSHHGETGLIVLGGVVLCFTGAEALYADLSHFGRRPIRVAWYGLVLPALLANYFGEGGLMLSHPAGAAQPFFLLVPAPLLWPMVILATLATVIASQALISGIFTLTAQAVHMGFLPRFEIVHTSRRQQGQVYVSAVNFALMFACAAIVLGFRSSERLGGAYGLAVIGTMIATSIVFYSVLRKVRKWAKVPAILLVSFFLTLEGAFLAGNIPKVMSGAWLPLVLAGVVFAVFWIWTKCSRCYRRALQQWGMPLHDFRREMRKWGDREKGTGIFLTTRGDFVPMVGRNRWLRDLARHEQILLVTILNAPVPVVPEDRICQIEDLGHGLRRITASFGFMQHPDVTRVLQAQPKETLDLDWERLVCYLPDPVVIPSGSWGRRRIEGIYVFLRRNSLSMAEYFRVPPREIVRVGFQVKL